MLTNQLNYFLFRNLNVKNVTKCNGSRGKEVTVPLFGYICNVSPVQSNLTA